MTQAQHTHAGTTQVPRVAVATLAAAAALAIALAFTGTITLPSLLTDAGTSGDGAVVEQSNERVISPEVMDAAREWESQRRAQSGEQRRVTDPSAEYLEKVREARGY